MSPACEDEAERPDWHALGADEVLERLDRIRDGGEVRRLTGDERTAIRERSEAFAAKALRTLAIASRSLPEGVDAAEARRDRHRARLGGMVGMIDPPRSGVEEAVARPDRSRRGRVAR